MDQEIPPSSNLRADMAMMLGSFGQVPESLRQSDLWLKTHPNNARVASVLNARCWLRTRRHVDLPAALKDCREAVDLDRGASAYRDSLGWTHLRLGDAAKAKAAFDRAIGIEARPFSLFGRGMTLLRLNDAAGSKCDLGEARQRNPKIDDEVRKQGFEFVDGVLGSAEAGKDHSPASH